MHDSLRLSMLSGMTHRGTICASGAMDDHTAFELYLNIQSEHIQSVLTSNNVENLIAVADMFELYYVVVIVKDVLHFRQEKRRTHDCFV